MDAYSSERPELSYSQFDTPVLIAASSETALEDARRSVEPSGARIGASLMLAEAKERILNQPAASAVWVELDADSGAAMDELLSVVARDALDERYGAVVSITPSLVDAVFARLGESPAQVIVNAGPVERAAALALAVSAAPLRMNDVAADRSAEQLRQLSDEVGRIASTLARLSAGPGNTPVISRAEPSPEAPPVSAEMVRSIIRARRLRSRYFPEELFADPAWDMLLDLLQAEISHLRVPVSSLCIAAAVPATTALRWLKTMVQQGIFIRRADPHDGRRVFVELAPEASRALRNYFAEAGHLAI